MLMSLRFPSHSQVDRLLQEIDVKHMKKRQGLYCSRTAVQTGFKSPPKVIFNNDKNWRAVKILSEIVIGFKHY